MLSRLITCAAIAVLVLSGGESPAAAACSSNCETERTQIAICSTCCKTCVNAQGEITYSYCDTRCVFL